MCRVVIVDDRATNRAIYTQLARSIGQDVVVHAFGDPAGALDWLTKNKADLIVTDHDMPRMHGEEFITRFRALAGSAGVPIMMITVCDKRQLRLRALESGATDFLRAPIDHCEFLTRARNLLKLSRNAPSSSESFGVPPETAKAPDEVEVDYDGLGEEARRLLGQCGDGGYALHVIEIVPKNAGADLSAVLRGHLRGADRVFRLDPLRYAVLQTQVADPFHAQILVKRLKEAGASCEDVAAFRIGTALPRAKAATASQRAADCLREAMESVREPTSAPAQPEVLLAPIVDLATGELAGAQLLPGEAAAEAADFESIRAAIACVAEMRLAVSDTFFVSLRLAGKDMETSALRLIPLLIEAGASPSRLDFIIAAREIIADPDRIQRFIRGMQALGVGITLDVGEPPARDLQEASFWTPLLGALTESRRAAITFSYSGAGELETGSFLRAWSARRPPRPPVLRAEAVPSPELLPLLRRAGVGLAQGPCFGAPLALRDLAALLAERAKESRDEFQARRA